MPDGKDKVVDLCLVDDIKVGVRHRQDLGDLDELIKSIKDVGLLHPVVVTPDNQLIAGLRRLEAWKRLGWKQIPVRVLDTDKIVQAEYDENELRKDFTPSERVAIAAELEPKEREAAKARQAAAGPKAGKGAKGSGSEKVSEAVTGQAEDKTAKKVGWSRPTYRKAKEVVQAAQADPPAAQDLQDQMDKTGKVSAAHRELKKRQDEGLLSGVTARTGDEQFIEEKKACKDIVRALQGVATRIRNLRREFGLTKKTRTPIVEALSRIQELLKEGA